MKNFFKKSLRNRLLLIFMSIGFIPFLTLLAYTIFLSETKIVNKIVSEHLERTDVTVKLIDEHINSLIKEVKFLSSLDLMDDILAEDIDKRVSRLLIKKTDDLNLDVSFMVIDKDSNIISSSNKELILKKHTIEFTKGKTNATYIKDSSLYIYSTIYASFNSAMEIGTLVLQYNLNNLNGYLTHNKNIESYIINPAIVLSIGKEIPLNINFENPEDNIINEEYVVVYKKLSSALSNFYIVYAADKSIALEFLYDFISFMLYISFFIVLIVLYISIKHSKEIVKPIEELTTITNEIINTQNYSSSLKVNSEDEIATLTHAFNNMLQTTSTTLVKLEDEIALMKKTKAASNAKSTFISSMSHELRTPLNSIIGSAQYLMVYEDLSEQQIDSIGNIESSAEYLLSMINEILDIAQIEAGKMKVHKENVDILQLVENCFEMLSPLADDKGILLHYKHDKFDNKSHFSDPKIFQQIVINLISNAIKFTQEGSILIELSSDSEKIYLSITDSGIGVDKKDLAQLFGAFVQLDNSMQEEHKGTGLGLSISKKLANLLDGDISIESDGLGHGSKAIFTLNKTNLKRDNS